MLFRSRHFFDMAEREFERARRYRRPLSVLMFDIDRFKTVNDTYGHAVGDQALRIVANVCRDGLREIDLLGRYGGEEFVALLPENDRAGGYNAAERLRGRVAETSIHIESGALGVTISLGVATLADDVADLAALIALADGAMYGAKHAGRNRVRSARQ